MHTPDQARELWCPMVRIARDETTGDDHGRTIVAGCNTDALGGLRVPNSCRCIADQCAMWRWAPEPHEPSWRMRGFCGLAGRPEVAP